MYQYVTIWKVHGAGWWLEEAAEPPDLQAVLPGWEAPEPRGQLHYVQLKLYWNLWH